MADTARITGTTAGIPFAHITGTEAQILDARPLDLVRLLCGPAVLADLSTQHNTSRAHLAAARAALGASGDGHAPDMARAAAELGRGIAHAIRPDGIERQAETALLQAAYWLLNMQAQCDELTALYASAVATAQRKH